MILSNFSFKLIARFVSRVERIAHIHRRFTLHTVKMANDRDLQFIQRPNPVTGTLEWSVIDKEDHDYFSGELNSYRKIYLLCSIYIMMTSKYKKTVVETST